MFITSLVQLGEVHYGMGKHNVFVSPEDIKMYGRVCVLSPPHPGP